MSGTIVLGFDGSPCARAALDEAIRLAKLTGDRIVIGFGSGVWPGGGEHQDYAKALRQLGEQLGATAVDRIEAAGIEAEAVVLAEKPADALLDLADQHGAHLIVVGTYGEGPITGLILGSTPHKLLHRSRVPVLVVPAPG